MIWILFPTHVGVIHFIGFSCKSWPSFSHASGSDPDNAIFFADGGSFFHMRGSSRHKLSKKSLYNIFLLKFFFHTYGSARKNRGGISLKTKRRKML